MRSLKGAHFNTNKGDATDRYAEVVVSILTDCAEDMLL